MASLELKKFIDRLREKFGKATAKPELKATADFAIGVIVKRTRLGYGVKKSGEKRSKLAPLRPFTIAARMKSTLSQFTSPKRSNLTATGLMLNSMRVIAEGKNKVTIGFDRRRRPDADISNDELSTILTNGRTRPTRMAARPFLNLSQPELKQVTRFYRQRFADLINR